MRRVFENSVNPAHSTSIARPCDGGVSELFRSCFFALAMFSRRWRENIASVPAGLLALWAKRTASRSAGADPSNCAPGGRGPPGVPVGLFSPFGLKTHGLQVRFAHPSKCALTRFARQRRANPASVPAGLFSPCGLKTHGLQVRFAHPPTSPRAGVARPGFRPAYFRPAGSKRTTFRFASLTLRNAPRSGHARPRFRPAYWPVGPNARPSGSLRLPSDFAPCGRGPPGVPAGVFSPCGLKTHLLQVRTGWTRVLVRRGC